MSAAWSGTKQVTISKTSTLQESIIDEINKILCNFQSWTTTSSSVTHYWSTTRTHSIFKRVLPCLSHSQSRLITWRSCIHISADLLQLIFQKKVTAPRKIQIALPNPRKDGRVCYYGYDVAMEWLVDYADTHWRRNKNYDIMSKTIGAVELLRLRSGIKHQKKSHLHI